MISVAGANLVPIAIFLIVYNMFIYYESFPTTIGFSSTRRDFFKGVLAHNILLCLGIAIIQGILMKIDPFFVRLIGGNPMDKFGTVNLLDVDLFITIFISFPSIILFCSVFNLLGALLYRYTYVVWYISNNCDYL